MTPEHRAIIQHIGSSAAALARAVDAVPPGVEARQPRPGEWSVRETLAHVRNVVLMVQGLRIRRLFYEEDPVFPDYDEAAYRRETLAGPESVRDLLAMVLAEQEQMARLLGVLPEGRWSRQGRHPELGVMSVEWLARRMGEHTEEHAAQIAETARVLRQAEGGRPS